MALLTAGGCGAMRSAGARAVGRSERATGRRCADGGACETARLRSGRLRDSRRRARSVLRVGEATASASAPIEGERLA
jgi:hypothetical protein